MILLLSCLIGDPAYSDFICGNQRYTVLTFVLYVLFFKRWMLFSFGLNLDFVFLRTSSCDLYFLHWDAKLIR